MLAEVDRRHGHHLTTLPSIWYPLPQSLAFSADWTFEGWTSVLRRNLSLPADRFVAGGFVEDPTPAAPMTTVSIIEEGVELTNAVKVFSQHTYQYSTCDPPRNAIATLPHLVDHQNITVDTSTLCSRIAQLSIIPGLS
jgi:hypothetical protein